MISMGMEQLKYIEDTPEEELSQVSPLPAETRSNVIEGPWQKRMAESDVPREPILEKKEGKVIEGPWSKPDLGVEAPTESTDGISEKSQELERMRQEILDMGDEKNSEELETKTKEDGDETEKKFSFSEQFTDYKMCEACQGKGRRWLIVRCPVCRGTGRVPGKSMQRHGYYT
jgi:hypothetical protein